MPVMDSAGMPSREVDDLHLSAMDQSRGPWRLRSDLLQLQPLERPRHRFEVSGIEAFQRHVIEPGRASSAQHRAQVGPIGGRGCRELGDDLLPSERTVTRVEHGTYKHRVVGVAEMYVPSGLTLDLAAPDPGRHHVARSSLDAEALLARGDPGRLGTSGDNGLQAVLSRLRQLVCPGGPVRLVGFVMFPPGGRRAGARFKISISQRRAIRQEIG